MHHSILRAAINTAPALRSAVSWGAALHVTLAYGRLVGGMPTEDYHTSTIMQRLEHTGASIIQIAVISGIVWMLLGILGAAAWRAATGPALRIIRSIDLDTTRPGAWAPVKMDGRPSRIPSTRNMPIGAIDPRGSLFRLASAERAAKHARPAIKAALREKAEKLGLDDDDLSHLERWAELPCSARYALENIPRDTSAHEYLIGLSGDRSWSETGVLSDSTWYACLQPILTMSEKQVDRLGRIYSHATAYDVRRNGPRRGTEEYRARMLDQMPRVIETFKKLGDKEGEALLTIARNGQVTLDNIEVAVESIASLDAHQRDTFTTVARQWAGDAHTLAQAVKTF